MELRLQGRSLKKGQRGRRLPAVMEDGTGRRKDESGSRALERTADGPKGQERNGNTGWNAIQKEFTVGTERTSTANLGVGTRHEGSRPHGSGQNNRARSRKLLVAKNKRANNGLRLKLPRMPAQ